ncbi:MAG: putative transposase [Saprospiraceae bacterium]|jgi:putative transposase
MPNKLPLKSGEFYHIYNRGNNRRLIFIDEENYLFFLKLAKKHISPIAYIYAYALLPNHFHFLVQIKEDELLEKQKIDNSKQVSQKFGNWFNAYTKAFNKKYNQVSSLFQSPFERTLLKREDQFVYYVYYLHWNPQKHGYVDSFLDWPHTSFHSILSDKPTNLEREKVLESFGGKDLFFKSHVSWIKDKDFEVLDDEG